jgi:hypothetical protein
MNEPMRTPELKFFRRADLVERDPPIGKAERRALLSPLAHVRRLEVG